MKEYLTPEQLRLDWKEYEEWEMKEKPEKGYKWNPLNAPEPIEGEVPPVSRISFKRGEDGQLRNEMGELLQDYMARAKPIKPDLSQLSDREHLAGSPEFRTPEPKGGGK